MDCVWNSGNKNLGEITISVVKATYLQKIKDKITDSTGELLVVVLADQAEDFQAAVSVEALVAAEEQADSFLKKRI